MKRFTTIGLAVFCAMALAVQAAEVPSVNTVGYVKLNVAQNFNLYAFNWEVVGGAQEVSVQDLLDETNLVGGGSAADSDTLLLYDPTLAGVGGYVQMFFFKNSGVPSLDKQWLYFNYSVATNMISRGDGFWLRHIGEPTEIVLSGQVPDSDESHEMTFVPGFNLFGSAYSADVAVQDLNFQNVHGGTDQTTSDGLLLWDPAKGGVGGYIQMFYFKGGVPNLDNNWLYLNYAPATDVLTLGQGAFFLNTGSDNVTLSEPKPYTL